MDTERKSFPFELEEKGLDPEARTFQGFASVFGNVDEGGDVIHKGAFKKTLREMTRADGSSRIKVFWIHDFQTPIGRLLEASEVARGKLPGSVLDRAPDATGGLWVKGYISQIEEGDKALTLMRDGVMDELSIGYKSLKEEMEDTDDGRVRHIHELACMDVSPVPLAMNAAALVTQVKEQDSDMEFKPEETEENIRVPVPGESGKHDGHRIRTITISADQGIKALYCGECKKVITYIFAKEKGWTMAKAKEWVKEHTGEKAIIVIEAAPPDEDIEDKEPEQADELLEKIRRAEVLGKLIQAS